MPAYGFGFGPAFVGMVSGAPAWVLYDFTALTPGGQASLPDLWTYSNATSGRYVETAAGVVVPSIAANVACVGRWGLENWHARTNLWPNPRNPTANSYTFLSGGAIARNGTQGLAPDGNATTPARVTAPSGGYAYKQINGFPAGSLAFSIYAKPVAGTILPWYYTNDTTNCYIAPLLLRAGQWDRYSLGWMPSTNGQLVHAAAMNVNRSGTGGPNNVGGTTDCIFDMMQVETGKIVGGYCDSSSAADRYGQSEIATLMTGGRLRLRIRFTLPGGRLCDFTWDPVVLYRDADNYIKWLPATGKVEIKTQGGTAYVTELGIAPEQSITPDQWVELRVAVGGGVATKVRAQCAGQSVRTLGTSSSPQADWPSGAVDVGNGGGSAQLSGGILHAGFAYSDTALFESDWIGETFPSALVSSDWRSYSGAITTLPTGHSYTRDSSGETVQTGTNTVASGLGANIPGAGKSLDAWENGLAINDAWENRLAPYGRDIEAFATGGTGATYSASGLTGPDGGGAPKRVQLAADGISKYYLLSVGAPSKGYYVGGWYRTVSGTSQTNVSAQVRAALVTVTETWQRFSYYQASGTTSRAFYPANASDLTALGGGNPSGSDVVVDFPILCDDVVPRQWSPNASVPEGVYQSDPVQLAADGSWCGSVTMRPMGVFCDPNGNLMQPFAYVVWLDANNWIRLDANPGVARNSCKIVTCVDGVQTTGTRCDLDATVEKLTVSWRWTSQCLTAGVAGDVYLAGPSGGVIAATSGNVPANGAPTYLRGSSHWVYTQASLAAMYPFNRSINWVIAGNSISLPQSYERRVRMGGAGTVAPFSTPRHAVVPWQIQNYSVGGITTPNLTAAYAANISPLYSSAPGVTNVLTLMEGHNDALAPSTPQQMAQHYADFLAAAKADHADWEIWYVTTTPRSPNANTWLIMREANKLLETRYASDGAVGVIPVGSIPVMQNPLDTTYYTDNTHFQPLAYDYVAEEFIKCFAKRYA